MKVAAGSRIVCPHNHTAGYFQEWIPDGADLYPRHFYINHGVAEKSRVVCEKCRQTVAQARHGKWEVRIESGWIA